uniref:Neurotransmitter-gated ion-channel transmembrane domain-containing protein n=1 Tax=Sinocyclocheilus grahami TaxID=75366 RepID=A0A672QQ64_SINGR
MVCYLFSFLLPPQNVDRSAFKMTLILGYTVFLLLMNDLLPVTGNTLPLINVFFSLCLALMVASLLETILVTNIQCGSTRYGPLPPWAKVLFLNYLAKLVCLSKKPIDQNCDPEGETESFTQNTFISTSSLVPVEHRPETKHCDPAVETPPSEAAYKTHALLELKKISHKLLSIRQQIDKHFKTDESTEEWIHLGQVIDRLVFCLYTMFLSVSFITIFVYWLYWYNKTASLI